MTDGNEAKRRLKKGERNRRRLGGKNGATSRRLPPPVVTFHVVPSGSPPAAASSCPYFVPDHSSAYEGEGGEEFFQHLESIFGPGAPQGRLGDGRPYLKFTDLVEPGYALEHYWLDPSGLEAFTAEELTAQLRDADVGWSSDGALEDVATALVPALDDRGRPVLDVQVRRPLE